MNTLTADPAVLAPLTTDTAIEDRALAFIGTADHRQLWLMLLDAEDYQVPVVVPLNDLPRLPDRIETDVLVGYIASLLDQVDAAQAILVWERPGRGRLSQPDAAWVRAVAQTAARRGLPLRAQLLSHTRGVTLLAPADYGAPASAAPASGTPAAAASEPAAPAPSAPEPPTPEPAVLTPAGASNTAGTGC